jgi:hypothetical protein
MHTRKEDDYCPLTVGMWENAISCTEGINKSVSDCLNDDDTGKLCFIAGFVSGCSAPLSACAAWLLCCSLPPVAAAACTPVTGLIDCCIFSTKKIGNGINKCTEGPQRQTMEDERSMRYGAL